MMLKVVQRTSAPSRKSHISVSQAHMICGATAQQGGGHRSGTETGNRYLHEVDAVRQRLLCVAIAIHHRLHCESYNFSEMPKAAISSDSLHRFEAPASLTVCVKYTDMSHSNQYVAVPTTPQPAA